MLRARAIIPLVVCGALVSAYTATAASATGTTSSSSSISGVLFNDANRNGAQDAGEAGFSGLYVDLFSTSGAVSMSVATDSSGAFVFTGLADGSYRVAIDPQSWSGLSDMWTPTTTGSLHPTVTVSLSGSATVPLGLRQIVRSTTKASPVSSYVGANGLTVNSYDDVVTAKQVFDDLMTGTDVSAEAKTVTILFDWGSASQTSYSIAGNPGGYYNYRATSAITWSAWLTNGDLDLFHEYGHAWSMYYAYLVQQDATLTSYLKARGLYGDPRVGSSYQWDPHEMIAEDYRELFGSTNAQGIQQMNTDVPRASQVAGLQNFLSSTFTGQSGSASPSPSPTSSPTASPSPSPTPTTPAPSPSPTPSTKTKGGGKGH